VSVGLLALGVTGMVWGIFTTSLAGVFNAFPVIGGLVPFVAGLVVLRWDLTCRT
jgi:hypothetical protein